MEIAYALTAVKSKSRAGVYPTRNGTLIRQMEPASGPGGRQISRPRARSGRLVV